MAKKVLGKKVKAKVEKKGDAGHSEDAQGASPSETGKKRKLDESEVKEREKRTMFVGNVPVAWDEKRLRRLLRTACGTTYEGQLKPIWFRSLPLESRWNTSNELRKAGRIKQAYQEGAGAKNAYVVLRGPEDVPTVVKLVNNLKADAQHVLRADGVGESAVLKKFDRKRSVFLGSLPRRVTEDDIRWVLSDAGVVDAVRIVRNKITQECQGFAFARFQERWSVKEALKLWGAKIHGKEIRITKVEDSSAQDKPGKEQSRPEDHPAAKRILLKQQRRERQKAKKRKEWLANAKTSGLRPGKSKATKKKLKQSKKKKAGR